MKICVLGLWHLGSVTAACCAKHFEVTGLDFDADVLANLEQGRAPISEAGLDDLLAEGLAADRLRFTSDETAVAEADVLWVCYDTPVDEDDNADLDAVLNPLRRVAPHLRAGTTVVLSSQLPVGTCRALEAEFPALSFACAPENLRLGQALKVFLEPERIVIGVRDDATRAKLSPIFERFCDNLIWMLPESAELTKHAINGFLALSVTYMNELASVCERIGADAKEVEAGLKSDARIGKRAYLSPGEAFAGGTLARDVVTLRQVAAANQIPLSLIPAIKISNDRHKSWALNTLRRELPALEGTEIAVLGLTYKPGTDTLRRSSALELCRALVADGAKVRAFDPTVREFPADLAAELYGVELFSDAFGAVSGTDALVICTPWPEFKKLNFAELLTSMPESEPLLLDANRFVAAQVADLSVKYRTVGLGL